MFSCATQRDACGLGACLPVITIGGITTVADQAPERSGGGNVFTRKLGPLPMWVWMVIALLLAVLYHMYSASKQAATSAANSVNAAGGVDSSLVPQFVNQVYTDQTPPTVNITNNPGSTGTTGGTTPTPPKQPGNPLNEILTAGHTISPNPAKAVIGWTISQKSPNATQLKVVLNGPGKKNQTRYIPASATTATFEGLSGGHTYVADITPVDAQGQAVGGPNHVTFKTAAHG